MSNPDHSWNPELLARMAALGLDTGFATGPTLTGAIERLEDRLTSGEFVRFRVLLDGIELARRAKRWDLVQECGTRALSSAGVRGAARIDVRTAARAVVLGVLSSAQDLHGLLDSTNDAIKELRRHLGVLDGDPVSVVSEELDELQQLRVLISSSDDPKALTALCSRLRSLERPDLGIQAATKALEKQPGNAYALTTRGAARIDVGDLAAASKDLAEAWAVKADEHPACALSRLFRIEMKYGVSLDWASEAVSLRVSWSTVRTLAAAAAAAGDEAASARAAKLFTELGQEVPSSPVDFVAVQGARLMVEQGDVQNAVRVLLVVADRSPDYQPARKLLNQLTDEGEDLLSASRA